MKAADVRMGWLDRILDINFVSGNLLVLGWFAEAGAAGRAGTVSTPELFISATSAPLKWNNALSASLPLDNVIAAPNAPAFSRGPREAFPNFDTTTTQSEHESFHFVDLGIYRAFQAEPGGLTILSLTSPTDPSHFLVPFEIDQTNGGFGAGGLDGGKDICGTIPGPWLDFHDRLNELNAFFPGVHHYAEQLVSELAGHNEVVDIDILLRTATRSVFLDLDSLTANLTGPLKIVVDVVGADFDAEAWCGIFPVEPAWPLDIVHAPLWSPPGPGLPVYTPVSFRSEEASTTAEGGTAHARFTFNVTNTASSKLVTSSHSFL